MIQKGRFRLVFNMSLMSLMLLVSFLIISCTPSLESTSVGKDISNDKDNREPPAIQLSIYYDDLNRNKNTDLIASNTGKLYDLQVADYSFDFSQEGEESINKLIYNKIKLFDNGSIQSVKLYLSGEQKQIGSNGWVNDLQIKQLLIFIQSILPPNNKSNRIDLYLIGAGTGAVALKYLISLISEQDKIQTFIQLENAVFFNPVLNRKYYFQNTNEITKILLYPEILGKNGIVSEFISSSLNYSTYKLLAYQKTKNTKGLKQKIFPGTHLQVTGGKKTF